MGPDKRALTIAVTLVATAAIGTCAFSLTTAPRSAVIAWLAVTLTSTLLLALAARFGLRANLDARGWTAFAMFGAIAMRAAALCAPVSLSDDLYRYLWDGWLLLDGHDPYASRPSEVVHLVSSSLFEKLNSPDYYTVYPPIAQVGFGAAVATSRALPIEASLALRIFFCAAELAGVFALLRLCARLELPRSSALLYAWSPLAIWEVAAGAHTEALLLPFVVLALFAALGGRPLRTGLFLGLAASAKLTILILVPVFFAYFVRRVGWRRAGASVAIALAVLAALFSPFASDYLIAHLRESFALYMETFSFNAPIYYGARYAMGYRVGWNEPADGVLMPILTAVTLACIAGAALAQNGRDRRLIEGAIFASFTYVVLSRVVHPWYLLVPLALSIMAESRAVIVFSMLTLLSYLRYDPLDHESPLVIAAPLAVAAITVAIEWRRRGAETGYHRRPSEQTS
jgi:hypothetical protein